MTGRGIANPVPVVSPGDRERRDRARLIVIDHAVIILVRVFIVPTRREKVG